MTALNRVPEPAPKGATIPPSLAMPTVLGPPAAMAPPRVVAAETLPLPAESPAWPRVFPGL